MTVNYSVELCKKLERKFERYNLYRPMRINRYEKGTELCYDIEAVESGKNGRIHMIVEKFVGGGFAGQVYKVKVTKIEADGGQIDGLELDGIYAIKILIPPSRGTLFFRNLLYRTGFQGYFQLQVNPAAAKAGAIWQKFIRRAAKIQFGDETAVNNIHATFVDYTLGSCGEISDWVEGRTWRLEVDDKMDMLKLWQKGKISDEQIQGSIEYRAKKKFMADFVKLLYDVGGYEFARQYEWSTCKSQPNCLKLKGTDNDPATGLIAVDFRAGLALLPFLPMSPGDFKLILKGLCRGSLVQFDRGSIEKLWAFVRIHEDGFSDMMPLLNELEKCENIYRDSTPDITHNHIRLFYSRQLWGTILNNAVTGWRIRNLVDGFWEEKLKKSKFLTLIFFLIGAIPILGKVLRKFWARADWRKHYKAMLRSLDYLKQSIKARITEKIIDWHRKGRISEEKAIRMAEKNWLFLRHFPARLFIFAGLERFSTDRKYAREKLHYIFVRPVKLYFNSELREQWLRDMVNEGQKKHILTDEDADTITDHLKEPYVQRYLISLVVHLLTLPLTQIVFGIIALVFYLRTGNAFAAGGVFFLGQVIPISPGSLARGLWAVGIAIYDRSFKDYNIAVFLSFFKYIGYLAFPIQMTYHYPALARFMASHWATEAVHIVPVFGERGALLEHWVFRLFYNWPLTIRRRMAKIAKIRKTLKTRYWHIGIIAVATAAIFGLINWGYLKNSGCLPGLMTIWWAVCLLPFVCGGFVTSGCGGAVLWRRIAGAGICGAITAVLYSIIRVIVINYNGISAGSVLSHLVWGVFVFSIFSIIGAIFTELRLPDPDLKK